MFLNSCVAVTMSRQEAAGFTLSGKCQLSSLKFEELPTRRYRIAALQAWEAEILCSPSPTKTSIIEGFLRLACQQELEKSRDRTN